MRKLNRWLNETELYTIILFSPDYSTAKNIIMLNLFKSNPYFLSFSKFGRKMILVWNVYVLISKNLLCIYIVRKICLNKTFEHQQIKYLSTISPKHYMN